MVRESGAGHGYKVDLEETHLPGEVDVLVALGYPTFIMGRANGGAQIIHFIPSVRFKRPGDQTLSREAKESHR